jgi:tRNA(Ile)-lysidine synthase
VSFDKNGLLHQLEKLEVQAEAPNRLIIAFSGGLDSSVLLHALADSRDSHGHPLIAVHVDHGLHDQSAEWARHCEAFSASLDVPFVSCKVTVEESSRLGPEAAAREVRYAALRRLMEPGDWLVSAHHQDDQAETLLLHLMRGSGPAGLAGIRSIRRFAAGWLARPLLDVSRDDLETYATGQNLDFIDDPSNVDTAFDRNFLRHDVIPLLESRWPGAANRIRRSAALQRESADLLAALADQDGRHIVASAGKMAIEGLVKLPEARQRNLLRHTLLSLGLPLPGAAQLEQIVRELIPAREDAQPVVAWRGGQARRYRKNLYLMPSDVEEKLPSAPQAIDGERAILPAGLGEIRLHRVSEAGLSDAVIAQGLEVRYRKGGEEIKPLFQRHTRKLKKMLQEEGVVPWMRDQVPLLYSDDKLVAIADQWIADEASGEPGTIVEWRNHPPIF